MRTIVYAAGALVLFAATPASAQRNYSYDEWSNGFGPPASYGGGGRYRSYGGRSSFDQQGEQIVTEGVTSCLFGLLGGGLAGCGMGVGQVLIGAMMSDMFQPQPRRYHYAEARPRRRVVRRSHTRRVHYASQPSRETRQQEFNRMLDEYLERKNKWLAPRVRSMPVTPESAPAPARTSVPNPASEPEPRVETPKPVILVNAQRPRVVFTRSVILRGDLVGGAPPAYLASEKRVPALHVPAPKKEIDAKLIRSAIVTMR